MGIFLFAAGAFFLILGGWLLIQKLNCRQEVQGTFVRSHETSFRGVKSCTPVFRYEFASCQYERESIESFSERKVAAKYVAGKSYKIFVNADKPNYFIVDRKIRLDDLGLLLVGLLCIFLLCVHMV